MKITLRLVSICSLICLFAVGAGSVSAQKPDEEVHLETVILPRDLTTDKERAEIEAEVADSIAQFAAQGLLPSYSTESVQFSWPLRAADSLTDYGYHGVSGFVDHDPNYNSLLDYMCGDRTYDLSSGYDHRGTDFFTFPFPWLKMDNDEVEIVAAADGVIYSKHDGEYDRQCGLSGARSNSVVLRHADGTITWYLHMKRGSLTDKAVGESVVAGEYLGIVGSSGSSTGPHLHFEVRTPANNAHIDPYEGPCHTPPSMWETQPSYYDSAVIAVHTGSNRPYSPSTDCGEQENTNIQTTYEPDDTVYFITYFRDLLEDQESSFRIKKPDDSVYKSWSYTATYEHRSVAYLWTSRSLDDDGPVPLGTWSFEVDFEGTTYDTEFYVTAPITISVISPNGGEAWKPGTCHGIPWDTNIPEDYTNFAIDLYNSDIFLTRIYTATPSAGWYYWCSHADLPPSSNYKIQIMDLGDPEIFDQSDGVFTIAPVPQAQFTYHPVSGPAPLTVTFTDTSTSLIDTWDWHFGNGMTSTVQHPAYTYTDTGLYTVTLTVSGPTGSHTLTRTNAVTVTPPPLTANFSGVPLWGTPPMTVTLTDTSIGPSIESWAWSFGDGITSTLQHPTHVYTQTGTYTVKLSVKSSNEEDSLMVPNYIRVVDKIGIIYLPLVMR
jgi:PKD repeat protein/murein DD-endopeptidase MepM/ murein hydrolase activator NlpD